jgi:hypothetical protein
MAKELRISATVEVPDAIWQQTDTLAAAKPVVEAFTEALEKMGGTVTVDLVTPKPRGEKGDPAAQYAAMGGKMPE